MIRGFPALVGIVLLTATAATPAATAEPPPTPARPGVLVDEYAVQPGHTCLRADPHRPGVEGTMAMLRRSYPKSVPGATWAPCGTHSGTSDHHTGRAMDWHPGRFGYEPTPSARADGYEVVNWLLATVDGVPHMRLRRLGIVYVIWDNRIWTTTTQEWRQYRDCRGTAGNPVLCHRDHIHLSLGVNGADGRTTWWRPPAATLFSV